MKTYRIISWVALALGFVALFAVALRTNRPGAQNVEAGPIPVESFSLVDQSSSPVTLATLQGKVWVADFIFTRCMGPCPMLTRRMKEIASEFPSDNLRFVSFSVDPEYDTPAVLKEYAERFEADKRWLFLTGKKEEIENLVRGSFMLGLDPGLDNAASPDITHSTRFVVVDAEGRMVGSFDTSDVDGMRGLRDELRRLKA